MQRRLREIPGRRRRRGLRRDHRLRQARRPREQLSALALVHDRQAWLKQLAHDPETEIALQLAAARMQHRQPQTVRRRARLLEQARLADPRRPLDHRQPPLASTGIRQQPAQHRQVALALQQRRRRCVGAWLG